MVHGFDSVRAACRYQMSPAELSVVQVHFRKRGRGLKIARSPQPAHGRAGGGQAVGHRLAQRHRDRVRILRVAAADSRTRCSFDTPTAMHRFLFAWAVALTGSVVAAQEGDPLASADCRQALGALHVQETAAMALSQSGRSVEGRERHTLRVPLETTRRRAASVCLGGRADAPLPTQRFAQLPVTVAPVGIPSPIPPLSLSVGAGVPLPQRLDPSPIVTACDAVGCWASDGSRLQQSGPFLLGPRGLCSGVQGTALHCP